MTLVGAFLGSIVVGDPFEFSVSVPGVPSGQTLTKAWCTVKVNAEDDDPGIIQKEITTIDDPNVGLIVDDGAGGTGNVRVNFTKSDTALLDPDVRYYFDVQVLTSGGHPYTSVIGRLKALQDVTRVDT